MKVDRQSIGFVLELYKIDSENRESLTDKIYDTYAGEKTLFKMPEKLIPLFADIANYSLDKKTAKKIVNDIACQTQLSELFEELLECDILRDKLTIVRKDYTIILNVHDSFIVKTDLARQRTYINDKFYYDIEEQDLLECYCEFVTADRIYVLYKTRRPLSYIGLSEQFVRIITDENKISALKKSKAVDMIFTNKELLYNSV